MAISTTLFDLTDAWQEVAAGPCDVLIQMSSGFAFQLVGASTAPAVNTNAYMVIANGEKFSASGMASGEKFFARRHIGQECSLAVLLK